MKALRLEEIGDLRLAELEAPQVGPDQILIRTGASTICTSDLQDIRENSFGMKLPIVLGHEGAGTVVEVGSAVSGIAVGDRVAAHPVHPCAACSSCTAGMRHLCLDMAHLGLNMQGTFAEFFVVRADRARILPPGVDFMTGCLMEPVCVCLEALHQTRLGPGESLLIIGDGPFGVLMARLASTFGPERVVVMGHQDFRLARARPATTINSRTTPHYREVVLGESGGTGYEAVIVTVPSAEAVDDGLEALRPKGRMVLFAPMPGKTPVDLFKVLLKELELIGSVNDRELMDEAVRHLADPHLDLADLVTHRFAIEDFRQAFELAERGQHMALKVALTF